MAIVAFLPAVFFFLSFLICSNFHLFLSIAFKQDLVLRKECVMSWLHLWLLFRDQQHWRSNQFLRKKKEKDQPRSSIGLFDRFSGQLGMCITLSLRYWVARVRNIPKLWNTQYRSKCKHFSRTKRKKMCCAGWPPHPLLQRHWLKSVEYAMRAPVALKITLIIGSSWGLREHRSYSSPVSFWRQEG